MNLLKLKLTITLLCTFFIGVCHSIPIGFNQAWFHNDYSHQYLEGHFDKKEVERIFRLTSEAHSTLLRLWFFESSDFPMIDWKDDQIVGLKKEFIQNVLETLRIASFYKVKVYMTFFDAHAYRPDKLDKKSLSKLRAIYQKEGGAVFLNKVITPLFSSIEKAGLAHSIERIDLTNEMDAVINRFGFEEGWQGAGRMLCQWRTFIQSFDAFKSTPVTFSLRLHPLIVHPFNLLSDNGPMACADYFDFHSYHDKGKIYRCGQLRVYAKRNKKELILGEFGQSFFNHRYDNDLQLKNTQKYINEAQRCGFKQALSWRLSDERPGFNKEARYSFEAFGQMRPAYELIKGHNQN